MGALRCVTTVVTIALPPRGAQTAPRWCRTSTTAEATNDSHVGASARDCPTTFSRTRHRLTFGTIPSSGLRPVLLRHRVAQALHPVRGSCTLPRLTRAPWRGRTE